MGSVSSSPDEKDSGNTTTIGAMRNTSTIAVNVRRPSERRVPGALTAAALPSRNPGTTSRATTTRTAVIASSRQESAAAMPQLIVWLVKKAMK